MADTNSPRRFRAEGNTNRITIFWIEVGFLLFLGLLAWAYFTPGAPASLRAPAAFGIMPSGVLWFGALGGVLISLAGVHEHRYNWDPRFWTWHLIRPVVGAAVGTIAVLIIMSGILAIGADPTPAEGAEGEAAGLDTKNIFYFLVAFIVGYREAHFRGLIKRLGDVFFTSAEPAKEAAIASVDPAVGPAAGGTRVQIAGSGLATATSVKFGDEDAPEFQMISDARIDATTPAGAAGTVAVTVVTETSTVTGGSFTYQ
jgi:hypothetical protein